MNVLASFHFGRYFVRMHKHEPDAEYLTTAQVAQMLGVRVSTISRRVARGELVPAVKVPGKTGAFLFRRSDIEQPAT